MKKYWIALLVIVVLGAGIVAAQSDGLPDVDDITEQLRAVQANFRVSFGQYAQMLPVVGAIVPTATPEVAIQRSNRGNVIERLSALITGEDDSTMSVSPLPTPLAFVSPLCPPDQPNCPNAIAVPEGMTMTVNVYTSPQGEGFEVIYETIQGALLFRRVVNHGPETWREKDWYIPTFASPLVTPETP